MSHQLPSGTTGLQARGDAGQRPSAPPQVAVLAGLNAHLDQASRRARASLGNASDAEGVTTWPPLRSAQRFHETWALISAETEVVRAEQRAPDNAGPLNSHRLVLDTLSHLRALSPEYLQAFLAQAETLLWLEQAPVQKVVKQVRRPAPEQAAKPLGSAKPLKPRRPQSR